MDRATPLPLGGFNIIRVTELKYEVLPPVYLVIRTVGGACASSSKQASPTGPKVGPKLKTKTPRWGSVAPRMGFGTTDNHLWAPGCLFLARDESPRAQTAGPGAGPKVGPKRPEITKNGARRLREGRQLCAPFVFMGKIHSDNVWAASLSCFDRLWLKNGVRQPNSSPFWVQAPPRLKRAKPHQNRSPTPRRRAPAGSTVPIQAQDSLGRYYGCPFVSIVAPKGCPWAHSGPIWAQIASCCPKPKNGRISV